MAGMGHQGTSRLAHLPDDQAPPLAPQWMTDNTHKQGPGQWNQERSTKEAPWMHDSRQEKMGWQDDKTRAPEARWDKQSVSPFPERPQPSFVDDGPIGGLRPGGAQAASKWREDGDRVLPRREIPAPTRWGPEEPRWMNDGPPVPKNDIFGGGAERWGEQKGRGRGALVDPPVRPRPNRDGFTDRWVGGPGEEPSPGTRPPRMEKWGPEGEPHDPTADRWGHRPSGAPFPPARGNPGGFAGPAAGFNEPHHVHQPSEPGRGRGFAAGRGRSMLPKGLERPQAPGAPSHWGGAPGPSMASTFLEPIPLGSKTATQIYNKKASVIIYKKLAKARAVILPRDVSQEDQTLFAGADQPDPMDVLAGIHDPGNGGEPSAGSEKAAAPTIPPPAAVEASERPKPAQAALVQAAQVTHQPDTVPQQAQAEAVGPSAEDQDWYYLDPSNKEQGPFSHSDILAWFDEGFYDDKLRIRPENGSFRELSVMLKAWGHVHKKRDISEMHETDQEPKQQKSSHEQAVQQMNNAVSAIDLNDRRDSMGPQFSHGLHDAQSQTSRFEQVFAQSQARPTEMLQHQHSGEQAFGRHHSGTQPGLPQLQQPHDSQELPRLPRSIVHPEGPVSGINGGYSFKMPGMEGWNAAPLPMGQIQPLPQHHQPQHQQPQQPQQQQGGMGQHLPYPQQLFSQPQQKPGASIGLEHMQLQRSPGASISLEHMEDPRFQRALEEGRQSMRDATPGPPTVHSWLEQGRQPAQQPQPGFGASWGPGTPGFPLPQPEGLHGQGPANQNHSHDPDQNPNPLQHLHAAGYGSFPGSFPGVPQQQQQQQHSMQQPPQQPQPQAQHSADPVIDPTRAGRAPSGPIGASLESRGSSSSNLATQGSQTQRQQPQMPSALANLYPHLRPMIRDTQQSHQLPPPVNASQHQMSSQPLPQPMFAEMPLASKSSNEELNTQHSGVLAPFYPPQPPQEALRQTAQPTQPPQPQVQEQKPEELVSAAPVPFEKVKHKKPKVKPAAQPPLEALQPFELRRQQQQQQVQPEPAQQEVRHVPPPPRPPPQPEPPQPPAAFGSKPAPWAHKRPAAVPGQRSILDIQKEEAERTRAQREAAEKAAAAAGLPAPSPTAGGWAKIAGGGTNPSGNVFGDDEATKRAIAASLRDQKEHEERARRQQVPASQPVRETLGENGTPAVPKGATLGDTLTRKMAPAAPAAAAAAWSASTAAQSAAKLQEVQAKEMEQLRKAQQKPGSKAAPAKAQANDDEDDMFWDYGGPKTAKGGSVNSATKANGAIQKPNGVPGDNGTFGTAMSPEFKEWCRQQMLKLSNKDDLTLVEFLMSCQSSGETAEYISAYLGKSPDVASFTAEFIRRKAAQLNSGKAKQKGAPGMEKKHPGVTAAGAGGGVPAATGWQKPAAKAAKKKGKGRKADATMLGFAAGLDYNAFERPET